MFLNPFYSMQPLEITHLIHTLFSGRQRVLSRCPSFLFFSTLSLFLALATWAPAQVLPADTAGNAQEASAPIWPVDSLDRRTPRGTVNGFMKAVAAEDYHKAARYLNLDTTLYKAQDGVRLAQALQRLLDQGGHLVPRSWMSDETAGNADDNLGPDLDRIGSAEVNGESFDLMVEKTLGEGGAPIWLFSRQTIQRIPTQEQAVTAPLTDRVLPSVLREHKWGGVPIGHWLSMVFLAGLAYLLAWIITSLVTFGIRAFWHQAKEEPTTGIIRAFALPIRLYLATWILVASSQEAGISIIVRQRFSGLTMIVGMVALLLLLWQLIDVITQYSEKLMTHRSNMSGISVVLFLRRGAKIALIVVGVIAALGTLGFDVTTGIAALGIGGIALALGAQKTVENFVGSVTLIADQPIRVGDFCKVGETVGTVEQIGMRSTRIRTNDRTVVTIPNGEFSSQRIENFAHRDRFLFAPKLRLPLETSLAQMRAVLAELRTMLTSTPQIAPDPRVRLVQIGADSLVVEIFSYVQALNFNEFLAIQEDLILQIMEVVETKGKGFAFPSQTLYLAGDTMPANERGIPAVDQASAGHPEGRDKQ
jgi:MscS family membrane protein